MALRTYLTGIADAIREKKGTSDPINAQDFASEISSISTGGGTGDNPLQALVTGKGADGGRSLCAYYKGTNVDFLNGIDFSVITNMSYMFGYCSNLTVIPQLDTSNVTNMNNMFYDCNALITIPQLNTSNVTDMGNMFYRCHKITSIPQLDTSNATNMKSMFQYCKLLTTVLQLDTSKVTNMSYMFGNCEVLTTVPQLNTNNTTNMGNMFNGCHKLQTIDITKLANTPSYFASACYRLTTLIIRTMNTIPTSGSQMFQNCYHFTGTVDATYNPDGLQDGRIYVPDDKVDALKAATGWSEFADIIVPLSTLVED